MKLLVDALIGKFGADMYSIDMLYGDADSKEVPSPPTGIEKEAIVELACKFSHGVVLKNDQLRDSAFFYDCKSQGSYLKATSTDLTFGVPTSRSLMLAHFDGLSISELNHLLSSIKGAAENPLINGKFKYSGIIHDVSIEIG